MSNARQKKLAAYAPIPVSTFAQTVSYLHNKAEEFDLNLDEDGLETEVLEDIPLSPPETNRPFSPAKVSTQEVEEDLDGGEGEERSLLQSPRSETPASFLAQQPLTTIAMLKKLHNDKPALFVNPFAAFDIAKKLNDEKKKVASEYDDDFVDVEDMPQVIERAPITNYRRLTLLPPPNLQQTWKDKMQQLSNQQETERGIARTEWQNTNNCVPVIRGLGGCSE